MEGNERAVGQLSERLSALEDAMEDRLHHLVKGEVTRGAIQHLEGLRRGHEAKLEAKVDKIVGALHRPTLDRNSALVSSALVGRLFGDENDPHAKQEWRTRFREAIGDSLYVKESLQRGRCPSADAFRNRLR